MHRRRPVLAAVSGAIAVLLVTSTGCSDGTPAFCDSLRANADLAALARALDAGDLEVAAAEARRLSDLAGDAPPEIRADLSALGDAVVEIVDLLGEEASGEGDAGELERRRDRLNDDLGELDQRSRRVTTWALEECGLRLD